MRGAPVASLGTIPGEVRGEHFRAPTRLAQATMPFPRSGPPHLSLVSCYIFAMATAFAEEAAAFARPAT